MTEKQYKLRFLSLFEKDFTEITEYISCDLKNPTAALHLVDEVQKAIRNRLSHAESFEPYPSTRMRLYLYYRIYVKNYIVFCVVINDVMEVRRILYSRKNLKEQLE